MSEWVETRLSEVMALDLDIVEVEKTSIYPIVGVLNRGRGLLTREAILGTDTAYKTLNHIRPGQIVYSRLKAFEGAITVVPMHLNEPAYASPEFPTFTCGPRLIPGFFALITTTASLWNALQHLSTGMGGRRERVKPTAFLTIEIPLPPVADQRRIIAVMSTVDAHIRALVREVGTALGVMGPVVSAALHVLPSTTTYGAVAATRSGPSWAASDESNAPIDGAIRVVKITNTKSDGMLDMSDERYVVGLPDSTPRLNDSSLIIIRTNGNRRRIGNVYRPSGEALGCAVSAFQFLSQTADPTDRDFLYWVLRDPLMQTRMSEAASGSTGLGNLAVRWLNAAEIPWSDDPEERTAVVTTADAVEATVVSLMRELAALRRVRSDLLTALLSQEINVDAAVDQFVERAA